MAEDEIPVEEAEWVDPETLPAEIETTWLFEVRWHGEDNLAETHFAWVIAPTQAEAEGYFSRVQSHQRRVVSVAQYLPENLAVHLRWLNDPTSRLHMIIHKEG